MQPEAEVGRQFAGDIAVKSTALEIRDCGGGDVIRGDQFVLILVVIANRLFIERGDDVDAIYLPCAGSARDEKTDAAGIADADADFAAFEIDHGLARCRKAKEQYRTCKNS
ncbi:MAG: hypothetical protein BWY77_01484 [bacterium ADurb.Bin431]|nr:MAG: hypothetical protein BWY77_01484 [bacterium ADurb.Bin431]